MKIDKKINRLRERLSLYDEMTNYMEIARRYFVMNFFDGVLTVLGVLIGYFVVMLQGLPVVFLDVLIPSLSVSVAIGISGITGGYLTERAERKAEIINIEKNMSINRDKSKSKKSEKTLLEKAESFATNLASAINGFAPFLGGIVILLPFLFESLSLVTMFIISFVISVLTLYLLGLYLAKIAKDNIWKYSLPLIVAGLLTVVFTIIFT
ncbi:MAG: hypothetical protein GF364_08750 [Candidatus Lokiarchaeota archaeon]|nr:hypothetical protein [Candidatus Lokiarchaeota archaeon]